MILARPVHDPWSHQGVLCELEPAAGGAVAIVATVFLTGRECPWKCVMCDLWQQATEADTPGGAIPRQIAQAIDELRHRPEPFPTHVKLYNAGSFFDPRAVPIEDYGEIARHLAAFAHVIVESHPALIGPRVDLLSRALERHASGAVPTLEIAMGLETTHPEALERLNKHMTVDQFRLASRVLRDSGSALRVFLLVHPPFVPAAETETWLVRSVDVAFDCGATAVSLIPLRSGNPPLDAVLEQQEGREPSLGEIEHAFDLALDRSRGRVFMDLWNFDRIARCASCRDVRRQRMERMNLEQRRLPRVTCGVCDARGMHAS